MAEQGGNGEHKMLFDLRGRRRNAVKVIYAILAVLMAVSLILFLGPGVFGVGGGGGGESALEVAEKQAERIEAKQRKEPDNADLDLALMRARVQAGQGAAQEGPNGEVGLTEESIQQWQLASEAWSNYLEDADKPAAGGALLIIQPLTTLAEFSRTTNEFEDSIGAAEEAQRIVAEQRPSLNSLSNLARLQIFNFEFDEAKATNEEAKKYANSKFQEEQLDRQLKEAEKPAKELEKQFEKTKKEAEKAGKEASAGGELQNPLGGALGGSTLGE